MRLPLWRGIAVHGFESLVNFRLGADVVVLGPGPIGLLEAMVARASGAGKIFAVGLEKDKERLEIAQQLGFRVIKNDEESALDIIRAETSGLGVDIVFDSISCGVPSEAIKYLKDVGQLVILSELHEPITFDGSEMMRKEIIISRVKGQNPSLFYSAIRLVENGRIDVKPIITHKIKIENVEIGFKMMKSSEGLKILLIP